MTDEAGPGMRRVRLAWRWRDSGISGCGPWTHRTDLVEAWLESLVRRSGERVDHWIEEETPAGADAGHHPREESARRDSRVDTRDLSLLV